MARQAAATLSVTSERVGSVGGGPVFRYTLANGTGIRVSILTYGGIVQRVVLPDATDVVLGFDTLEEYVALNNPGPFFGAVLGRYCNRIAGGTFTLDDVAHRVPANDGPHSLHGGPGGFDTRVWRARAAEPRDDRVGVVLRYRSPDGEMGFPGAVDVSVTYSLTDDDAIAVAYRATADAPTVVNLSNHTYWNLADGGAEPVDDAVLWLNASRYTPVDETLVPTGELLPVAGTALDFRRPTPIGDKLRSAPGDAVLAARGYDHNVVLDREPGATGLRPAARLLDPVSGRALEVATTEPALQLYAGGLLDGTLAGKGGTRYGRRAGVALETQHFPDSPNQPGFPTTVLRPGRVFASTTVFRLTVVRSDGSGPR